MRDDLKLIVTGSTESVLIAQGRKFDFFTQTQSLMNALSVSLPQSTRVKWSAFAGCFFRVQWRAVRVVLGLDGALANQEMAVCGCTAPWCWTMTCAVKFLSF